MTILERRIVMTKPPSDSRQHDSTKPLQGIVGDALHVDIRLTASAERYAQRHALLEALKAAVPGPASAVGDIISVATDGILHDFAVRQRRWIFDGEMQRLELTIDHPAFGRR
jgi:hypothetical protein